LATLRAVADLMQDSARALDRGDGDEAASSLRATVASLRSLIPVIH